MQKTGAKLALDETAFLEAGDRSRYSFKIEYSNAEVAKISNSAVARDLAKTLELHHIDTGNRIIRMGKDFILTIE